MNPPTATYHCDYCDRPTASTTSSGENVCAACHRSHVRRGQLCPACGEDRTRRITITDDGDWCPLRYQVWEQDLNATCGTCEHTWDCPDALPPEDEQ